MIEKKCNSAKELGFILGILDSNKLFKQCLGFSEQNFSRYILSLLENGTLNILTFLPDEFQNCMIEFVSGVTEFQRKDIVVHFKVIGNDSCELNKGDHILIIENKVFSIVDNTQLNRYCSEYNTNNKVKEIEDLFLITAPNLHFSILAPLYYSQNVNNNCNWHRVTYKKLFKNPSLDPIFKKLVETIYLIIEPLAGDKQNEFLNKNYCDTSKRVSDNISQLEKYKYGLDSFYKKHLAAQMAYALFDKLKNTNTFNGLVITDNWQREDPNTINDKYVICHGFSNGEGLIEVIYFHSVESDDKKKIKNPKAVIIQVQGNDYRTGIISNEMVNYSSNKSNPTYKNCEKCHNNKTWFFGNKKHSNNNHYYYTFGDMYFTKESLCGNNNKEEKKSSTSETDISISKLFNKIEVNIKDKKNDMKDIAQCIFNNKKCP